MRQPPAGTVTFLFTDIEGSTRLWEDQPDAMRRALARHDLLLSQAISGSGGYVFKTVGDAFCAAFATAPEALAGALGAQIALGAEPWETKTPLRVRMALHVGSAEERGGDYFGPPLNRVARLLAAGHGGQTLLSAVTQELTRDALPAGAGLRDLGDASLKDLTRPERVFQLLHPLLAADFPPLRSLDNPALPNNLPQQLTSFIGREREMAEVKGLLAKVRLLTLTGAGGSGKTRLALQVAADLLDGAGGGVWLVEMAALADPALVPQTVAQVLGVKEQAGESVQQTLMEALKAKRLLLILDNCEHLVSACASLAATLLRSCPDVHVLATSREPLNVPGEQTYRVPSLSSPGPKGAQTVEALSQYEAVRLFIERAQAVQPSFAVTDRNAPAIAQICFHLDGIPLALELAAARVRALSAEEINARLDNRFRLLTGGARTALPRQQTLRALIDWSYDLLAAPEKALLGRLSVFAGGWTLEAAEAVCGFDPVEGWETLDLMTGLVDKSLALAEGGGDPAATRYRMVETLREYARERLALAGETAALSRRHVRWCLAVAKEAARNMGGAGQAAALNQLGAEHDNLRAALAWCGAESPRDPAAESDYPRLAAAAWRFWHARGHLNEGREYLTRALKGTPPAAPDAVGAEDLERARLRGRLLRGAGNVTQTQGDYDAAEAFFEEGLAISRFLGDENGIASAIGMLGNIAADREDHDHAGALYAEALAMFRRLGDQAGTAWALSSLANVASERGDLAGAQSLYEESLAIYRRRDDWTSIAWALGNLGSLHYDRGDHGAARASYLEGLRVSRGLEIKPRIAVILSGLGSLALAEGDARQALVLWAATQALRDGIGVVVPSKDRTLIDGRIAEARARLGAEGAAAAWEAEHALTWEQAVALALGDDAWGRPGG